MRILFKISLNLSGFEGSSLSYLYYLNLTFIVMKITPLISPAIRYHWCDPQQFNFSFNEALTFEGDSWLYNKIFMYTLICPFKLFIYIEAFYEIFFIFSFKLVSYSSIFLILLICISCILWYCSLRSVRCYYFDFNYASSK